MAERKFPEDLVSKLKKLLASLPFLKGRIPSGGIAPEPFDTLEDGTGLGDDEFEPNAAVDLSSPGGKGKPISAVGKKGAQGMAPLEALRSFADALLRNRLGFAVLIAVLFLVLAIVIVAIVVSIPPSTDDLPPARTGNAAVSPRGKPAKAGPGKSTPSGEALMRRMLLPSLPSTDARVELERPEARVYTSEDAARYLTDPKTVDTSGLKARNDAEVDALYGAVP
jgi:hypothetical protein